MDERVELTLVYAPLDASTDRLLRGVYELPASGSTRTFDDFDGAPGFYSLTVFSEHYTTSEVISTNSSSYEDNAGSIQFEVVIEDDGGLWTNVGEGGSEIEIPD